MRVSATSDRVRTCWRISSAPSAQFRPTEKGRAWLIETQKASGVWPVRVRPDRSVMVPEIISGGTSSPSSARLSMAKSAALALSVSKIVSTRIRSTPASIRARAASP